MDAIHSMTDAAVADLPPRRGARVLPLPGVVDSQVVVLLHLALNDEPERSVVLDASGTRRICPLAALLLTTLLRRRREEGTAPRIVKLSHPLRRMLEQHPLREFTAGFEDDVLFLADSEPSVAPAAVGRVT